MTSIRRAGQTPVRIEICGGIASGKTTLAKLLARGTEWTLVRENFRRNPFWAKFYADPVTFMREKNISFLPLHTGAIKSYSGKRAMVCDYAVFQDLAYARLSRSREHFTTMSAVYRDLYASVGPPTLFIHLECTARVQLARIRARHRREELSITVGYLQSLNEAIRAVMAERKLGAPIKVIRADQVDFAHEPSQAARIKAEILSMIDEMTRRAGPHSSVR